MADPRARFHLVAEALNSKTTVVMVSSIQIEGEKEVYAFPQKYRQKEYHTALFETSVVQGVSKSLTSRGKYRNVWISLTGELREHYLDDEGNVCYDGYYLEELQSSTSSPTFSQPISTTSDKLSSRIKSMLLDKFSNKNQNASVFIEDFVAECKRFEIEEKKYAETLKFFLEGPALDWFQVFLMKNKITRPWEHWKNSFIDTFAVIGWSEVKYAYNFRYLDGPLLDYALKKRNLLLGADPDMSDGTQINMIVLGLPSYLQPHIKSENAKSLDSLMAEIHQLEGFMQKNKNTGKLKEKKSDIREENSNKQCSYCAKKGFSGRVHAVENCRLKLADKKNLAKNEKIKIVNNSGMEESISSSDDSKNE